MKVFFFTLLATAQVFAHADKLIINDFLGYFSLTNAPETFKQVGNCFSSIQVNLAAVSSQGQISPAVTKLNETINNLEDLDQDYLLTISENSRVKNPQIFYQSKVKPGGLSDNSDDGIMLLIMSSGFPGTPGINKKGFSKENSSERTGWIAHDSEKRIFRFVKYLPKQNNQFEFDLVQSCFYQ